MGRTPNTIELESLSVRYPPPVGDFLRKEVDRLMKAKGRQYSLNDVIREMIEAFRTMFGLPAQVVEVLDQDARASVGDHQSRPTAQASAVLSWRVRGDAARRNNSDLEPRL